MKKLFNVLCVVTILVTWAAYVANVNKLEKDYNSRLESIEAAYESKIESIKDSYESKYNQLNDSKVELENQVYRCMTGETYDITIEHDDELHNWYCTDNKGLFKNKGHLVCY